MKPPGSGLKHNTALPLDTSSKTSSAGSSSKEVIELMNRTNQSFKRGGGFNQLPVVGKPHADPVA